MENSTESLRDSLLRAGLSTGAIDAAWPEWWSDEMEVSPSSRAELRFTLARRLGLKSRPLLGERVEFVWPDRARYKNMSVKGEGHQDAMSSFGVSLGKKLLRGTPSAALPIVSAEELRAAILANHPFVDLQSIISTCWALGIPVAHLRVFPLSRKSMHAMVINDAGRYSILLARDASYPAPVAFTLAHELGHVMLGHLDEGSVIVDLESEEPSADQQETEADHFALTLLAGTPELEIITNTEGYSARSLATAALSAAASYQIEPGTLALCLAYVNNDWPRAMAAMRYIYSQAKPVWREVNSIAERQIQWDELSSETSTYLHKVLFAS